MFWAVPSEPPNCGAPAWELKDTQDVQTPDSNNIWWGLGGNVGSRRVNVDHVYEVQILKQFFEDHINVAFDCDDVKTLFDQTDHNHLPGTRLNTIFAQLASYTNPDFLGMDSTLNGLKGGFWNREIGGQLPNLPLVLPDGLSNKQALVDLTVIMEMLNDPDVQNLFENTNSRIYQAFRGIDNLISYCHNLCCYFMDHNQVPMQPTWALSYSTWINAKISTQNSILQ